MKHTVLIYLQIVFGGLPRSPRPFLPIFSQVQVLEFTEKRAGKQLDDYCRQYEEKQKTGKHNNPSLGCSSHILGKFSR